MTTHDSAGQAPADLPDYQKAGIIFCEKARNLGYSIDSSPIPARPGWQGDKYAGHVSFTITHAPSGRSHQGQYSSGSGNLIRWALDPKNRAAFRGVWPPVDLREFRNRNLQRNRTIHEAEQLQTIRKVWRPDLSDVLLSMFLDVSGYEVGMSFREWLQEGTAEGMNAADALECFQEIERTERFLRATAGTEYESLAELAGMQ